jgi:1-acyl-sn-glycerol-3-phosphate acyltransferase
MDKATTPPTPSKFYPQRLTPWLVRLVQFLSPTIAHWFYKVDLVIAPECQGRLQELQEKRLLLLCNHPTFDDPIVVFLLSARLGVPFYYLADAMQLRGKLGPLLQRLGTYSIRRGRADRESVRHTLALLGQPDCKLVIFPEGGCSFQNDTVMPFREGALQMALQSLAQLHKEQPQDSSGLLDLYGVPLSIKYRYRRDVRPIIASLLQRLEQELALAPTVIPTVTPTVAPTEDTYQRLRMVGVKVLERCEQDYQFASPETEDLNQRVMALKHQILAALEQCFEIKATAGWADRERVYRIQHLVDELEQEMATQPGPWQDGSGQTWTYDRVMQALRRVLNFDAIYDGYVAEQPSPERYLDTLIRLEREVFGIEQPIPKGWRQAFLYVGKPINLRQFVPDFRSDRTTVVQALNQQFQDQVQENLNHLSDISTPSTTQD